MSNETLIKDAEELAVTVHSFDVGLKHQILRKLAAALRRTESERDAAIASLDALAKGARDVPCFGACSDGKKCIACSGQENLKAWVLRYEVTEAERDAQHEQVLRLAGERDELQRRIDRIMDPPIKRLNVADGEMNVSLDAPEMASIIATAFWDCLDEHNAENYVEMTCAKPDKPLKKIVITARKLIGRTPDELKRAAERERDELLEKVKELESTRDLLLAENARLQNLLSRPDPVVHETPVDGVVPCCGRKLADLKDGSYVNEGPLVSCDRMRLLTRVGELKSENLLLTKERDAARAQADELLVLRAEKGWMP